MRWWEPRDHVAAVRLAAMVPFVGGLVTTLLPVLSPAAIGPYEWVHVLLGVVAPGLAAAAAALVLLARRAPRGSALALGMCSLGIVLTSNLLTLDTSFGAQVYLLAAPLLASHHLRRRAVTVLAGSAVLADAILLGVVDGAIGVGRDLPAFTVLSVGIVLLVHRRRERHLRLLHELQVRSARDALTGLGTRRVLDEVLARDTEGCVVLVCDVDEFKGVNDRGGHAAGDAVLRAVADRLHAHAHDVPGAVAARLGGDELVLVLPAEPLGVTAGRAERLRASVAAAAELARAGRSVTVSIGIAAARPGETPAAALARADAALYAAKAAGRDRVGTAGDDGTIAVRPPARHRWATPPRPGVVGGRPEALVVAPPVGDRCPAGPPRSLR